MFQLAAVIFLILFLLFFLFSKRKQPAEVAGIYAQPGQWHQLKYMTAYNLIWLGKIKEKLLPTVQELELESLQSLSSHEKAFDAVFFHGVSQQGFYLCGGIEKRHAGRASAIFFILHPEFGLLESCHLPKTLVDCDVESILSMKSFAAGGIKFQPMVAMKKWALTFDGPMKYVDSPSKTVKVTLDAVLTSDKPYFLMDRDLDSKCLADALAREKWNGKFFKNLMETRITHYEQMGHLEGTLTIDDHTQQLSLDSFREHNFGYKLDWSLMHRYIYHMLYMPDGTRISFGVISQPDTLSELVIGYVLADNRASTIEGTNLKLIRLGDNGRADKKYGFCLHTCSRVYQVDIEVVNESIYYKGVNDGEALLLVRFLDCKVNGIPSKGISEWHYNLKR